MRLEEEDGCKDGSPEQMLRGRPATVEEHMRMCAHICMSS